MKVTREIQLKVMLDLIKLIFAALDDSMKEHNFVKSVKDSFTKSFTFYLTKRLGGKYEE